MANNFEELIYFKKLKNLQFTTLLGILQPCLSGLHLESTCNSILG